MTDEDLKEYIPKYGDRIAVLAFARRIVSSESMRGGSSSEDRKRNLLMRLKDRLSSKKRNIAVGEDSNQSRGRYLSLIGNINAKKVQRRLEVGWLDFDPVTESYKQVKTASGGGTRQLKLDLHITMAELLETAKILFFPNGESMQGKLDEFTFDISDFSKCSISQEKTLEEVYNETKMKLLRVYMATTRRCASVGNAETKDNESSDISTNKEATEVQRDIHLGQLLELGRESSMDEVSNDSSFDNALQLSPEKIPLSHDMPTYCHSQDDSSEVMFSYLMPTSEISDLNDTIGTCVKVIQLHRGHVFKEFIDFFLENSSLDLRGTNIEVEMILPNGQKEAGEDSGGILRDALSEFWHTFYETCTVGNHIKVPAISHIMTDKHWKACARIIILGYKQERYFPIQLALPFLSSAMDGPGNSHTDSDSLVSTFMEYISDMEKEVFIQASTDFESVNFDDILEACESHDVRHRPTKDNISTILKQVAHKELVQAPAFVAECWHDIFCLDLQPLLPEDLSELLLCLAPTTKKVLQILDVPDDLSNAERETVQYLKKYIKGLSEDMLRNFLRFVTGADLLTVQKISVRLVRIDSEFIRRPIAHTCGCVLELSSNYESFVEFRREFNGILESKIWIMDII
ncbi:hypothetical protein ACJMK2_007560 [Sinanodonta woodiana]|uniref:HECT domain-containing protein n=1 Tax=Sinanodonta woodiana TaxID=1069815 RepID=A0ABD3VIW4_SINWO